jgi:hypothetical protein
MSLTSLSNLQPLLQQIHSAPEREKSALIEQSPELYRFPLIYPGVTGVARVRHLTSWERDDPPTILPPGMSMKKMQKITVGVSHSEAQELSSSLGFESSISSIVKLNNQLTTKLTKTVTLSEQHESSVGLTLTNTTVDHQRRYAFWHISHEVVVDHLVVKAGILSWQMQSQINFVLEGHPVATSYDVPLAS